MDNAVLFTTTLLFTLGTYHFFLFYGRSKKASIANNQYQVHSGSFLATNNERIKDRSLSARLEDIIQEKGFLSKSINKVGYQEYVTYKLSDFG